MINYYSYWKEVSKLIDEALELKTSERLPFLRKACKDNPALLEEATDYLSFIEKAEEEQFLNSDPGSPSILRKEAAKHGLGELSIKPVIGLRIGAYEIIEPIGEGGMGMVYLAKRADGEYETQVAIKFLRGGFFSPSMRKRFSREKKILAQLNHPNIAQIIDGGITPDGSPYIIMEYVDGTPVDSYCDNHKLNIRQRLSLFQQICNAVQFAHSKLIIHRDLKPDNIFITNRSDVKVMDFGIAKFLAPQADGAERALTREGCHIASVEYASPEQLGRGESNVGTDVYGLGVLLYLLTTGKKPFKLEGSSFNELKDRISSDPPPDPSLDSSDNIGTVQSDLKAIILKSLRKEPDMRYKSVIEFSEDINRYLSHEPVRARHGNIVYKARKFIKRNSRSLTALLTVVLILSGFTFYHLYTVNQQLKQISMEAETARTVTGFLVDLFDVSDPVHNADRTLTASALLERGQMRFNDLDMNPGVQLELLEELGRASFRLGNYINAEAIYLKADSIARQHFPSNSYEVAKTSLNLGVYHTESNEYLKAETHLIGALDYFSKNSNSFQNEYAEILLKLGECQLRTKRPFVALETMTDAMNAVSESDLSDMQLLHMHLSLARTHYATGDLIASETLMLDVLSDIKQLGFERYDIHRMALISLGHLEVRKNRFFEANSYYLSAMNHAQRIYGDMHPNTLKSLYNVMYSYIYMEEFDKAIELAYMMLDAKITRHGTNSTWEAEGHGTLGLFYFLSGDFKTSTQYFETSFSIFKNLEGNENPWTVTFQLLLSFSLQLGEETQKSAAHFQSALAKLQDPAFEADYNSTNLLIKYAEQMANRYPNELDEKLNQLRRADFLAQI